MDTAGVYSCCSRNLEQTPFVTTCSQRLEERIDLVVAEPRSKAGGIGLAVVVSFLLHGLLIAWFVFSYRPVQQAAAVTPMTRYVELIKQNPSEFVEAPGQAVASAPLNAPLSNANRKAAIPEPTGDKPTQRPGDGGGLYQPPANPAPRGPQPPQQASPQIVQEPQTPSPSTSGAAASQEMSVDTDRLVFREPTQAAAAATGAVDWKHAIREAAKIASLGSGDGIDLGQLTGGEKGFAEAGPLSFETAWFDWGDYAQSMVSRIRVNWYAAMPEIIRTGIQGVTTIRFTIHRDGRITDVILLKSSGVPPYDHAAKKAIEASSPLNPLPKNFPNATERVTAMFYYNKRIE